MEKGSPEVPWRWSSSGPGDNRTHRCHKADISLSGPPSTIPISTSPNPAAQPISAAPTPPSASPPSPLTPRSHPLTLTARIIQEQNVIQTKITPVLAGDHRLEKDLWHQTEVSPIAGGPGHTRGGLLGLTWYSLGQNKLTASSAWCHWRPREPEAFQTALPTGPPVTQT